MDIEQQALSSMKKSLKNMSEQKHLEKNKALQQAAKNFLEKTLEPSRQIIFIRNQLLNSGEEMQVFEKIAKLMRVDQLDSKVYDEWQSFQSQLKIAKIEDLEKSWNKALEIIYKQVEIFQQRIFDIWGDQSLAYVTVQATFDGKQVSVKVYEFKPSTSIERQSSEKGGGYSAKVKVGRKSKKEKDESFEALKRQMKRNRTDSDAAIEAKYQNLSNTYFEVLKRYDAAVKSGKGRAIWWFTNENHDDLAGAVEIYQKGDLAETFVSFIPILMQKRGKKPPYSGILDPSDVGAFMTGTINVDATRGRLVGDVLFKMQHDNTFKNLAVKAAGASHMGYMQMIDLAQNLSVSKDPLNTLIKTQKMDIEEGKKTGRNKEIDIDGMSLEDQETFKAAIQLADQAIKDKTIAELKKMLKS